MRFVSWLKKSQERILAIGWRLALFEAFNWVFNNPLYFWAMSPLGYGIVTGWIIMSTASLVLCAWFFWRYDRDGVDWLFANAAREWREAEGVEHFVWLRKMGTRISASSNGLLKLVTLVARMIVFVVRLTSRFIGFIGMLLRGIGLGGLLTWLRKVGIFVIASINLDPVIVAVHYRKSHFTGLGSRDWGLLLASVAIGNLWWGARVGLFVEILKWATSYF